MESSDIKTLRDRLNLTQEEFANKIGVSLRTIQNYEGGGKIPKAKMALLEELFYNTRNINITGKGNIANTGRIAGGVNTHNQSTQDVNKIIESLENTIRAKDEIIKAKDEIIKMLKEQLAKR